MFLHSSLASMRTWVPATSKHGEPLLPLGLKPNLKGNHTPTTRDLTSQFSWKENMASPASHTECQGYSMAGQASWGRLQNAPGFPTHSSSPEAASRGQAVGTLPPWTLSSRQALPSHMRAQGLSLGAGGHVRLAHSDRAAGEGRTVPELLSGVAQRVALPTQSSVSLEAFLTGTGQVRVSGLLFSTAALRDGCYCHTHTTGRETGTLKQPSRRWHGWKLQLQPRTPLKPNHGQAHPTGSQCAGLALSASCTHKTTPGSHLSSTQTPAVFTSTFSTSQCTLTRQAERSVSSPGPSHRTAPVSPARPTAFQ